MEKKISKEERLIRIPISDMEAVYIISPNGQVSFSLIPSGEENVYFDLKGADPLVQYLLCWVSTRPLISRQSSCQISLFIIR